MLAVEYHVMADGRIEVVARINAVDADGTDADGEVWLSWRRSHADNGLGCAQCPPRSWPAWRPPGTRRRSGPSSRV